MIYGLGVLRVRDFYNTKLVSMLNVDTGISLGGTVAGLSRLDAFAPMNEKFQQDLASVIMDPIVSSGVDGHSHGVRVEKARIRVDPRLSTAPVSRVLDRIVKVLECLRENLPPSVLDPLSHSFIPTLSSNLISSWLKSAIPTNLEGLEEYEMTLERVLGFSQSLWSLGWHGHEELVSWVNQAARLWLTKQRVDSLDQVRKVLTASQGATRQVEREGSEAPQGDDEWDGHGGVTQGEKYTITDVPDSVLMIVRQQITDAEAISEPMYKLNPFPPVLSN